MDDLAQPNEASLDPTGWVDNYGNALYRYAMSRLRDGEASEEVVQETFVAGLRLVDQYSGSGSELVWLINI